MEIPPPFLQYFITVCKILKLRMRGVLSSQNYSLLFTSCLLPILGVAVHDLMDRLVTRPTL